MKSDALWEAAMAACYGDKSPNLTQSERKKIGKLLNELREIGATPEELTSRAKRYKEVMPPGCILTLAALVHNWARCIPQKRKASHASHTLWQTPEWQK